MSFGLYLYHPECLPSTPGMVIESCRLLWYRANGCPRSKNSFTRLSKGSPDVSPFEKSPRSLCSASPVPVTWRVHSRSLGPACDGGNTFRSCQCRVVSFVPTTCRTVETSHSPEDLPCLLRRPPILETRDGDPSTLGSSPGPGLPLRCCVSVLQDQREVCGDVRPFGTSVRSRTGGKLVVELCTCPVWVLRYRLRSR